jgi:hypothetical protein
MREIKFKLLFNGRTYGVTTDDIEIEWDHDHSGTYVLSSEANERIKVLEDALKEIMDCYDSPFGPPEGDESTVIRRIARAALEVK